MTFRNCGGIMCLERMFDTYHRRCPASAVSSMGHKGWHTVVEDLPTRQIQLVKSTPIVFRETEAYDMYSSHLVAMYCPNCGHKIAGIQRADGAVLIQCPRCKVKIFSKRKGNSVNMRVTNSVP